MNSTTCLKGKTQRFQNGKVGMNSKLLLFVIVSVVLLSYSVNDVLADSDTIIPSVSFDRSVYPVPFGGIGDFEDVASITPDGRSIFPVHLSAIRPAGVLQEDHTVGTGNLVTHIRITDANFDVARQDGLALFNEISQDMSNTTVGPLKITVSRDSQTVVLAYAGGNTPNKNGLIDVGDNDPENARQLGSISELAPDAGIFELDFVIRYTDGPSNSRCPVTGIFASLNDNMLSGSEESRFDTASPQKEDYCIMNGDILTVEYSYLDESGNVTVSKDTATFELRDGTLESDKLAYKVGYDLILTLTEPDFDLDNDEVETYDLDLIEWDSAAATVTLGFLGGEISAFDPMFPTFRETGDSTGIFQAVIEIPQTLRDTNLEDGEEVILEYTDWGTPNAQYVGQEDEDINWIFHVEGETMLLFPVQQLKQGTPLNEIECKEKLVLVLKYDESPACVSFDIVSKLIQRGWIDTDPREKADKNIPKYLCELYGGGFFDGIGECVDLKNSSKCQMLGGTWNDKCTVLGYAGKGIGTEPNFDPHPESENEN